MEVGTTYMEAVCEGNRQKRVGMEVMAIGRRMQPKKESHRMVNKRFIRLVF